MQIKSVEKKQILRRKSKLLRKYTNKYQKYAAIRLSNHVNTIINFFNPKYVSGYWPIKTELSPLRLLNLLEQKGCKILLPKINPNNKTLNFHIWSEEKELIEGPYGVLEPSEKNLICSPDLVLVPLLAYDKNFNRLGYGGGFYDRTITNFELKKFYLGIAFDNQIVDKVPTEEFDQKLDAILTPSGLKK